jgi:oxygen-independent coproporphyrinogen-3 oxidase
MVFSIYLHIPFCEVKCGYCDFFSVPRGYEDFALQGEYVDQLIREIESRSGPFAGRPLQSIFFGGGTPSLLDPPLVERIFATLGRYFVWDSTAEITLEANPKTVSLEKLKAFRSLGVNRLSIGVQSFQDRFLKVLGRIHTGDEARRTVEEARRAGFENLSCDLIYALPGQSFEDWKSDLEEAILLGTPHLSAYHLTIEEGTPFARRPLSLPSEEVGIRCLQWTREHLSASGGRMEPYEISNFSKAGFESVHNRNYWHYGEYLGFGTAAASFIKTGRGRARQANVRDIKKYLAGSWNGFAETIDFSTAMGEFCMLALRTREGIVEGSFQKEFGKPVLSVYSSPISRWTARGWLERSADGWRLTSEGILFADEVAASFLP